MKYLILALLLSVSACSTTPSTPFVTVDTKEVKVLVTQPYPQIPVIERPVLEISKITATTPPGTVAQAYQITVQQLINLIEQLEAQIAGVNKNAR